MGSLATRRTRAIAVRAAPQEAVNVKLSQPARAELDLSGRIFFPTQHSIALIEKALAVEPSNPLLLFRHGQFLNAVVSFGAELVLVWFLYFGLKSLMIACPRCRQSVFIRDVWLERRMAGEAMRHGPARSGGPRPGRRAP